MQYSVSSGAAFAVTSTTKTILNVISTAAIGAQLVEFGVFFDGVNAGNTPVLIELCRSTQAGAGTPGSSPTPVQVRGGGSTGGAGVAATITAGAQYSAEPTVLTVEKQWLISPTSGLLYQAPAGRESEDVPLGSPFMGLALRITAPQNVNARAYMELIQGPS